MNAPRPSSRDLATGPWLLPDEPRTVRLMNTIWADRASVHDVLSSPEGLRAWLDVVDLGVSSDRLTAADRDMAVALRDALRTIATWVAAREEDDPAPRTDGVPVSASAADDAIARLNHFVLLAPDLPRLARHSDELRIHSRERQPGVPRAVSVLAAEAVRWFGGEESVRLRACRAPGCVLFFTRGHPRRLWCSPACGNRARVARHYDRHRDHA